MNRPLAITAIVLLVLAGLGFGGRVYATRAMSARALRPKALGAVTPAVADRAGRAARKTAFGSALGATVLLQAIDSVQPYVDGIVIEGVTASVKEAAVRDGRIPKLVAPLIADIGDNVAAARRVNVPLLAVHSYADNRFPFEDAERVVAALPAQYSLVKHWRRGHSAILASSKSCDWAPILAFARTGALPAAKTDT